MKADWAYELHVIGTVPRHLPLDDFGELTRRFADLLGAREHLRFGALTKGSANIRARVLETARDTVTLNLVRAKLDDGAAAAKVVKIDDYLASRGWNGELRNRQGRVLLVFPGATAAEPAQDVRTVQQVDSMIGTIIKIGGRDDSVPMQLKSLDGRYLDVTVRGRELARRLASSLFQEVRVSGVATWERDTEGEWSCITMIVDDFEKLSDAPLSELFDELGQLPGNEWNEMANPDEEWLKLRRGDQ